MLSVSFLSTVIDISTSNWRASQAPEAEKDEMTVDDGADQNAGLADLDSAASIQSDNWDEKDTSRGGSQEKQYPQQEVLSSPVSVLRRPLLDAPARTYYDTSHDEGYAGSLEKQSIQPLGGGTLQGEDLHLQEGYAMLPRLLLKMPTRMISGNLPNKTWWKMQQKLQTVPEEAELSQDEAVEMAGLNRLLHKLPSHPIPSLQAGLASEELRLQLALKMSIQNYGKETQLQQEDHDGSMEVMREPSRPLPPLPTDASPDTSRKNEKAQKLGLCGYGRQLYSEENDMGEGRTGSSPRPTSTPTRAQSDRVTIQDYELGLDSDTEEKEKMQHEMPTNKIDDEDANWKVITSLLSPPADKSNDEETIKDYGRNPYREAVHFKIRAEPGAEYTLDLSKLPKIPYSAPVVPAQFGISAGDTDEDVSPSSPEFPSPYTRLHLPQHGSGVKIFSSCKASEGQSGTSAVRTEGGAAMRQVEASIHQEGPAVTEGEAVMTQGDAEYQTGEQRTGPILGYLQYRNSLAEGKPGCATQ
ncbi:hypothetical protein GQ43DRAFT_466184 [Delitschia confertaspora ATCC 74209]|uniref:Uncharacterized protein n=1 Tax=Delitschia confertaspora ATCC 74209 TaxID=1513339 RepID=A0A9P4MP97_9PLEO|nr:hypothetical protein GQ43DRAFT_466184 [Delitschia confertaspora ATCC 74209]